MTLACFFGIEEEIIIMSVIWSWEQQRMVEYLKKIEDHGYETHKYLID